MTSKKWAIKISGIISIISIFLFVFLQFNVYKLFGISGGTEFCKNLKETGLIMSSGLFTGAFVSLLISIKEYKFERKLALENLYFATEDILNAYMGTYPFLPEEPFDLVKKCLGEIDNNKYAERMNDSVKSRLSNPPKVALTPIKHDAEKDYKMYLLNNMAQQEILICKNLINLDEYLADRYESKIKEYSEKLEFAIDSFLSLKTISTRQMTIAMGGLDFLFANRTILNKIHSSLYQVIFNETRRIKNRIYDFNRYKEGKGGNRAVQCSFLQELQSELYSEDEKFYYCEFCFRISQEMDKLLEYANGRRHSKQVAVKDLYIIQSKPQRFFEFNTDKSYL